MQIGEPRPIALSDGPGDPIGGCVDPDAELARVRRSIGREEVAMAAAHLPDKAEAGLDDLDKVGAEQLTPLGHSRVMLQ